MSDPSSTAARPGTSYAGFRPSDDELWTAVGYLRQSTADLLERLSDSELDSPSLCPGWRIRDVAAHITMQGLTLREFLVLGARYYRGGDTNALILRSAQQKAKHTPMAHLVAELRDRAELRRPNFGVPRIAALFDILAHGQDIAIPLHREFPVAPRVAAWAATGAAAFRAKDRLRTVGLTQLSGVTLTATDIDWSMGEGPEVRGPMLALFMVVVGRTATLDQLTGLDTALR